MKKIIKIIKDYFPARGKQAVMLDVKMHHLNEQINHLDKQVNERINLLNERIDILQSQIDDKINILQTKNEETQRLQQENRAHLEHLLLENLKRQDAILSTLYLKAYQEQDSK